jgi:hypothetical protein
LALAFADFFAANVVGIASARVAPTTLDNFNTPGQVPLSIEARKLHKFLGRMLVLTDVEKAVYD